MLEPYARAISCPSLPRRQVQAGALGDAVFSRPSGLCRAIRWSGWRASPKASAYAEVYNDLDEDIANFFRVLRDPDQAEQLIQSLHLTPYARAEFDLSYEDCAQPVERARRTAVGAGMGFGSAGATKGVTGLRIDTATSGAAILASYLPSSSACKAP